MEPANLGDFVYFRLIDNYLRHEMTRIMLGFMERAMSWAGSIALMLVTLWVMVQGYRIATGQSRQPMMRLVVDTARIALIVSVATTMAIGSTNLYGWLTKDLDREIHSLLTGDHTETSAEAIDHNLAYTQLAVSAIDIVQVPQGDHELLATKSRTTLIANFGIASPPMTAAAMSLMYQLALLLWLALAPLFILSLIFEQTRDLFRRWLMYGIGTLFGMAALSAVTAIALEMNLRVAIAFWGAKVINGMRGDNTEGLSNLALQQGGLGLLLTMLIVSVPPMVSKFFRGTLANFMPFSAFGQGTAAVRHGGMGYPAAAEPDSVPSAHAYRQAPGSDQPTADQIKRGPGAGAVWRAEREASAMADAARGDPGYWTAQVGPPAPGTAASTSNLSSSQWVNRYPTSTSTTDLIEPFRSNVQRFITAMEAGGADVRIAATLRPPERAYLMHYAYEVAHGMDPASVPSMNGVSIDWTHLDAAGHIDLAASRFAAQQMVDGYGIAYPPALSSRHSEGRAIDMGITNFAGKSFTNGDGVSVRVMNQTDLVSLGSSYGVVKLPSDPPHWSDDGH
ncbi:TrbL/VirB6 plasmid conjugal transfer protein [Dyella sp. OK004]|uniref:type IV secretion system protein n=1 Tax=Dyella sp. OK004 TaxID=1855292 RepID=UPI0008E5DA4E|nr:type IV secretion system protein [Dyella sp. OK004]SFS08988.1 TrbL/VirB6 plasmid conjugal transfer protein [Dyella sp. OK004]